MLDEIVARGRGGPPGQFHDNSNGQNGSLQEIMIPAGKAGLIIGKGGETIKQLQVCDPMRIEWWNTDISAQLSSEDLYTSPEHLP